MPTNNSSFTKDYDELQRLTAEFEKGNLDLELAIPKFKRAAELAKNLKKRLSELENQIEEINLDLEKDIEAEPETPPVPEEPTTGDIEF